MVEEEGDVHTRVQQKRGKAFLHVPCCGRSLLQYLTCKPHFWKQNRPSKGAWRGSFSTAESKIANTCKFNTSTLSSCFADLRVNICLSRLTTGERKREILTCNIMLRDNFLPLSGTTNFWKNNVAPTVIYKFLINKSRY